ncbi:MAG: hypothetical protein ACKVOB_11665 [Sphingomonas sp.]
MMDTRNQCRKWYDVEATDAHVAIVSRVLDAAVYLRQRIYVREIRAAASGAETERAWARHRATYDWQTRTTRAQLAHADRAKPVA